MKQLLRNRRNVYLCNRIADTENGRIKFSTPVLYKLNFQPLSTDGEIIAFGNDYINRLAIYTSVEKAKNFHNFDRCYVYTEPPATADDYCIDADYYVDGEPLIYLNEATIYLQRMVGDSDE